MWVVFLMFTKASNQFHVNMTFCLSTPCLFTMEMGSSPQYVYSHTVAVFSLGFSMVFVQSLVL